MKENCERRDSQNGKRRDHLKEHHPLLFPHCPGEKKDGTIRFCVDYCKLIDAIHKYTYPLLRIDDILESLQGAKHFCSVATGRSK